MKYLLLIYMAIAATACTKITEIATPAKAVEITVKLRNCETKGNVLSLSGNFGESVFSDSTNGTELTTTIKTHENSVSFDCEALSTNVGTFYLEVKVNGIRVYYSASSCETYCYSKQDKLNLR